MKPICFTIENEAGEEIEHRLPSCWNICDTCRGNGSRVNPAVDGHGLSREDFDEDPDFRESYFRGDYDVPCSECGGTGKVLAPDESAMTPEQLMILELYHNDRAEAARDRSADAYTRRMENGGY